MKKKMRVVGYVATIVAVLFSSAALAQQYIGVCNDPADEDLFRCLREISSYTNWMVVQNTSATTGKLQQEIDDLYKGLQEEWRGPLRKQTYMRRFYLLVPAFLMVYLFSILFAQRSYPPRFPPGKPARWRAEKGAIMVCAIGLMVILIGERCWTYRQMGKEYDLLPTAVEPFIHVRSPVELVNHADKPCELLFKEDNILLSRCKEDWSRGSPLDRSRLATSRITDPELIRNLIAIGRVCQLRSLPTWFTEPSAMFDVKMSCPVSADKDGGVTLGDLHGLFDDFRTWSGTQGGALLKLENAFGVRAIEDDSQYRTKVQALIGQGDYRIYQEQFERKSALWVGIVGILLLFFSEAIYYCRRQQLDGGSEKHGKWQQRTILGGLVVSSLALVLVFAVTMLS